VSARVVPVSEATPRPRRVAVGTNDGVHLGHRALVQTAIEHAEALGVRSAVATFHPRPVSVIVPERAPDSLTTIDRRLELLRAAGADDVVVIEFTRELAAKSAEEFAVEQLVGQLGAVEVVVGQNFRFGRGRSGDVETLRRLGGQYGFAVDVVPAVDVGDQHVSSSRIRRAVAGGDLATAARMLGRPYQVSGVVGQGERRGRQLGVPTINLAEVPPQKLLPPDGVYAVAVEYRGGRAGGMMHQGPRPTFDDGRRVLEAHLFDFDGDLYGEWVRIEWVERLRDIERFATAEQLKKKMEQDRHRALAALAGRRSMPTHVSHA